MHLLTGQEITGHNLTDWRYMRQALHTRFDTGSFAAGLALVNAIGAAAEAADHHPDLDLHYGYLIIRLWSHDASGVTNRDIRLARTISELAAAAGHIARPETTEIVELCIDAANPSAVRPFWRAVLGLVDDNFHGAGIDGDEVDLVDPAGHIPSLWFQQMTEPRPDRSRTHVDVYVPDDVAEARVQAALAAGGTLLTDRFAPAWWVLADSESNECCVCTWQSPASG